MNKNISLAKMILFVFLFLHCRSNFEDAIFVQTYYSFQYKKGKGKAPSIKWNIFLFRKKVYKVYVHLNIVKSVKLLRVVYLRGLVAFYSYF